jgi:hypothetical protein
MPSNRRFAADGAVVETARAQDAVLDGPRTGAAAALGAGVG